MKVKSFNNSNSNNKKMITFLKDKNFKAKKTKNKKIVNYHKKIN